MMKLIGLCLVSLWVLAANAELDYSLDDPQFLAELNEGKLDDQLLNNLTLNSASSLFVSELTNGDDILPSNRVKHLHITHEDCPLGFAQRLLESVNNVRARHGAQPLVLDDEYARNWDMIRRGAQIQFQSPFTELVYDYGNNTSQDFRFLVSPDQLVQNWYLEGLQRYHSYGQEPSDEVKGDNRDFIRLIWASANLGAVVCEVEHRLAGGIKNSFKVTLSTNANLENNFNLNVLPPNYLKWESDIEVVIETDDKTNV